MALVSNRAKTMDPISPNRATPIATKMVVRLADSTLGPSASCSSLMIELDLLGRRAYPLSHLAEHVFDDGVARQDRLLDGRGARRIVRAIFLHLVHPLQELAERHGLAHRCEVRGERVPEQARHLVDRGLVMVANEVADIEPAEQQALVEIADRSCRLHILGVFDDLPNDSEIRGNGLAELGQTLDRFHSLLGELLQIVDSLGVRAKATADLLELGAFLRLDDALASLRKQLFGLAEAIVEGADELGIVAQHVLPDMQTRLEDFALELT